MKPPLSLSPEELNVDERLRVQLWDSDRTTAGDNLGRIEVDIKRFMRDSHTIRRCVIDKTDLSHSRLERRCQGKLTRVLGISRRRESQTLSLRIKKKTPVSKILTS